MSWWQVTTHSCYSLCIPHVLIFINEELVPLVHAKVIGLFTTPPPNLRPSYFWVLLFKKTKSFSFQFRETGLLAAYKTLPTGALQRHYLCCQCLTRSSWAKKLLSSHNRGEAPHSWTRSERGDLNIRLLKSSDECLQCDFKGSNPLLLS